MMLRGSLAGAALCILCVGGARAEPVENAYTLCAIIDGTGLASSPCDVSGWSSEIVAVIDMTSAEARKLCGMIVQHAADKGMRFEGQWTLQIRSPYSGENSIAFCKLQ